MQLKVVIRDRVSGREWDIEAPDDVAMSTLLPEVTERIGLSQPEGAFKLRNGRTGHVLLPDETLASCGTRNGDALELFTSRQRNLSSRPLQIKLTAAGNGWIVEGVQTKSLVYRFRDHDAMIDLLDKACRGPAKEARG
jgi:uncharacterized ubiquitin-like protein YukD